MKKYVVFILSFILLFSSLYAVAQFLFGFYLTFTYSPDTDAAWEGSAALSQQVEITSSNSPLFLTIVVAFLSMTLAFFISKQFKRKIEKHQEA